MRITVDPARVRPGDVILVLNESKHAVRSLIGQTLLHIADVAAGKRAVARYSHVMLGISPGVVIHADGDAVKVEVLLGAISGGDDDETIERTKLRVMRPDRPPLEESTAERLNAAALAYHDQKYTFVMGRRSGLIGRLRYRNRHLTQPFCSELVAAAYEEIGRPIMNLPADRVLPIDLQEKCVPPGWRDVTDEYLDEGQGPGTQDTIWVEGGEVTLTELFEGAKRALLHGWGLDKRQTDLVHAAVRSTIESAIVVQQSQRDSVQLAALFAVRPQLLFVGEAELVRADLSSLELFYAEVRSGIAAGATPAADGLQKIRPDVDPDQAAYEGLLSVNKLRALEVYGASLAFRAKARRLDTELAAIAGALGLPIKNLPLVEMPKPLRDDLVRGLPPLPEGEMTALLQSIQRLTLPPEEEDYESDVRLMCANIVRLHALLLMLCFRSTESTESDESS